MSSVAFSPSFMVVTPSSQPVVVVSVICITGFHRGWSGKFTLDDLANANGCDEITAANGGVESEESRSQQLSGMWTIVELWHMSLLGAFVVGRGGVLQVASVLDGDLVAELGDGATAFLENCLGDTHDC
jgi:hypothetical protein